MQFENPASSASTVVTDVPRSSSIWRKGNSVPTDAASASPRQHHYRHQITPATDAYLPVSPSPGEKKARFHVAANNWAYKKFQTGSLVLKKDDGSTDSPIKRRVRYLDDDDDDVVKKSQQQHSFSLPSKPDLLSSADEAEKENKASNKKKDKTTKSSAAAATTTTTTTKYKAWEFGKKKSFVPPRRTKETHDAAVVIQKIARAWWQRLKFRVVLLQHRLDTKDDITAAAVARVRQRTEQRKTQFLNKLKKKYDAVNGKQLAQESSTVQEASDLIAYLRRENKKLREKNEKIRLAIASLREQNDRLEFANTSTDTSFTSLTDHAKQIEETSLKLKMITPKYRLGVDKLQEAVDLRREYCVAEYKIKASYARCIGQVVARVEDWGRDLRLVDEVMGHFLKLEGEDNAQELPPKLEQFRIRDSDDMKKTDNSKARKKNSSSGALSGKLSKIDEEDNKASKRRAAKRSIWKNGSVEEGSSTQEESSSSTDYDEFTVHSID